MNVQRPTSNVQRPKRRAGRMWSLAGATALLLLGAHGFFAQTPSTSVGVANNFKTSEYFNPPNQKQIKYELTGAEARPQPGGKFLITKMKIQAYAETGERQIVIEAPECLYDSTARMANSAGHLLILSGDGRFSVGGEGFLWQQSNGTLTISNQVRSEIQRVVTNTVIPTPLVITSRWFTFDATNRHAVFHEDVRGEDPEIEFTCGRLAIHASTNGSSFEVIEATESPVIIGKAEDRRATGDRAIYTRADERAELIGNATWAQGRQSGRADRVVVRRLEKDFVADGHVAMKLPRESLGAGGALFATTNAPTTSTTNDAPLIDLFADRFHGHSNVLVAAGSVRVVDVTNRLSCDKLTVVSATPVAPEETATAEGNVVVEKGDGSLRARQAVYTKSDGVVVFTGEPSWSAAQINGRAERVTVHNQTGEIHAENQVSVRVQLGTQSASFVSFFPAADTNRGPLEIEVFAREFTATDRQVIFRDDVRTHQLPITGSEPRLRSDEMEVKFAADTARAESLQARNNVVFEQGLPGVTNGPSIYRRLTTRKLTAQAGPPAGALADLVAEGDVVVEQPGAVARGARATYAAVTDLLTMTGNPTLDMPQARITEARTLVWDKAKNRFAAAAPYRITFVPDANQALAAKKFAH